MAPAERGAYDSATGQEPRVFPIDRRLLDISVVHREPGIRAAELTSVVARRLGLKRRTDKAPVG